MHAQLAKARHKGPTELHSLFIEHARFGDARATWRAQATGSATQSVRPHDLRSSRVAGCGLTFTTPLPRAHCLRDLDRACGVCARMRMVRSICTSGATRAFGATDGAALAKTAAAAVLRGRADSDLARRRGATKSTVQRTRTQPLLSSPNHACQLLAVLCLIVCSVLS